MNELRPVEAAETTTTDPFDRYDLQKADEIVRLRHNAQGVLNLRYYNGDHWALGDGWIGPLPEDATSALTEALIKRMFISRNVVAEVVWRHVTGVAGSAIGWSLAQAPMPGDDALLDEPARIFAETRPVGVNGTTPFAAPQPAAVAPGVTENDPLIDEATEALQAWLDRMEATELLQQAVASVLLSQRSVLRLFVPSGLLDENGQVPTGDLADSLDHIWLQCLNLDEDSLELQEPSATVYVDKTTRREIGVMVYTYEDDDLVEEQRAELCYVDEDGMTVLRLLNRGGDIYEPVRMDLGGRLTMYEMTRRALVTPQMISQQKALNLAETMRARNDEMGGFIERILLNTQLPGTFVEDANAPNGRRFVPDTFVVGAGTTNVLHGIRTQDELTGRETIATPSVVYRDPVSPDTFIRSSQAAYTNILGEANQLHYAMSGDAGASGESRKQAREAYTADLNVTATKVQAAMRWVLETALAMAATFSGREGEFSGLRATATAQIDAGAASADEMRLAGELVERGLWSRETGMRFTGVEDPEAEQDAIRDEEKDRMDNGALSRGETAGMIEAAQRLLAGER